MFYGCLPGKWFLFVNRHFEKYGILLLLDNTFSFRKWWNLKQNVNVLDRMLLVCTDYTSTLTNYLCELDTLLWFSYIPLLTLSLAFHVIVLHIMKEHFWPSLVLSKYLNTNFFSFSQSSQERGRRKDSQRRK